MAREVIGGHYKGSNKSKMRAAFDKGGAKKAMKEAEKLGIAISTARNYVSEFTTGNVRKPAASKSAKKVSKSPARKVGKVGKKAKTVAKKAPRKTKVANLQG